MAEKYPITPAIRFLRAAKVDIIDFCLYKYEEHGGTRQSAKILDVAEHNVIKTIVLVDEKKQGKIVLMHGDLEISTKNFARSLNLKNIEPAKAEFAKKITGYEFGGTSPFGTRQHIDIFIQKTIFDLGFIWINGGKRGFLIKLLPENLQILNPQLVDVAQ